MTKANPDYRPRVSIDCTEEQMRRFQEIPWGIRKHVLAAILEQFLDLYEKHGQALLGAILSGDVRFGQEYSDGHNR